jgi:hypothetical protein
MPTGPVVLTGYLKYLFTSYQWPGDKRHLPWCMLWNRVLRGRNEQVHLLCRVNPDKQESRASVATPGERCPQNRCVIHSCGQAEAHSDRSALARRRGHLDFVDDREKSSTRTAESLEEAQAAVLFSASLQLRRPTRSARLPRTAFSSLGEVLPSLPAPTVVGLPYP